MRIEKEIISKIERDYLFIIANLDLDSKYFIDKINEDIISNNNLNYKTNVVGKQTSWNLFNSDEKFKNIIISVFDYLDNIKNIQKYRLESVWGIKEDKGDYTRIHDHLPSFLSGIIYLNKHPQKLYLPEINQEITPDCGKLILFSSFLKHYTKRNSVDNGKYAIAFNINYNRVLD
tara:strand:- start:47 stop:571 length:525 start_codon:yes stop_codon:yes gene_type:complete